MAAPDREMICGLVGASAGIVRVAVLAPAVGHLLVNVKFPAGSTLAPATLRTERAVPLFAIVTVTGADEVPASAPPKLVVPVGDTAAVACTAVPPTVIIWGLC